MGKSTRTQRAGRGFGFMATKRAKADACYINYDESQKTGFLTGEVTSLIDDCGRSGVLAEITFEDGRIEYVPAAEGIAIGQKIYCGKAAEIAIGNTVPLSDVPEGCPVFNIEKHVNDGGKYVRSSGGYALIMSKDAGKVYIKLPSGKQLIVEKECRATVGCVSSGARKEKPFVKAGKKYHACKGKGKRYPTVRGVAMNPVSHPHGGSQHHVGRSKSVSRHSPPGAKVGSIASKRTGRKKR